MTDLYHCFCGYEGDDYFELYETAHDKESAENILKIEGQEIPEISNRVIFGKKIPIDKVLNEDIDLEDFKDLTAYYLIEIESNKKQFPDQYYFREEEIYEGQEILDILKTLDKRRLTRYILLCGRELDIEELPFICIQAFEIKE